MEELGAGAAPPGGALFVATPDEEHLSEGMKTACVELARLRDQERLNTAARSIWIRARARAVRGRGRRSSSALTCWRGRARGRSTAPDALEIAGAVVLELTADGAIAAPGAWPAVLGLDDLKPGTASAARRVALVEFTVPWPRGAQETLARCRDAIARVRGVRAPSVHPPWRSWRIAWVRRRRPRRDDAVSMRVRRRAPPRSSARACAAPPGWSRHDRAARAVALHRRRRHATRAPRRLVRGAHGLPMRRYPFISDASYPRGAASRARSWRATRRASVMNTSCPSRRRGRSTWTS